MVFKREPFREVFTWKASWRASRLVRTNTRAEVAYCLQNQSRVLGSLRRTGFEIIVFHSTLLSGIPCPHDLRGSPSDLTSWWYVTFSFTFFHIQTFGGGTKCRWTSSDSTTPLVLPTLCDPWMA